MVLVRLGDGDGDKDSTGSDVVALLAIPQGPYRLDDVADVETADDEFEQCRKLP